MQFLDVHLVQHHLHFVRRLSKFVHHIPSVFHVARVFWWTMTSVCLTVLERTQWLHSTVPNSVNSLVHYSVLLPIATTDTTVQFSRLIICWAASPKQPNLCQTIQWHTYWLSWTKLPRQRCCACDWEWTLCRPSATPQASVHLRRRYCRASRSEAAVRCRHHPAVTPAKFTRM